MAAPIDLSGQTFGRLTVVCYLGKKWLCRCICGETKEVSGGNLKTGNTTSCGCARIADLTGQQFGMLTAIALMVSGAWLCRCACGAAKEVSTGNLRAGHATSCGCLAEKRRNSIKEEFIGKAFDYLIPIAIENGKVICQCVCGATSRVSPGNLRSHVVKSCGCKRAELIGIASKTHGQSVQSARTPEYSAWQHMKQRCLDPECDIYRNYGGRGISIYEPWISSFEAFFEHIGPRPSPKHSIDRIENDGNYEPGNVRWATPKQQTRNTRRTKLDEVDLKFIRHWLDRGYLQKDIAAAFGVHKAHIANINIGHKWASDT